MFIRQWKEIHARRIIILSSINTRDTLVSRDDYTEALCFFTSTHISACVMFVIWQAVLIVLNWILISGVNHDEMLLVTLCSYEPAFHEGSFRYRINIVTRMDLTRSS